MWVYQFALPLMSPPPSTPLPSQKGSSPDHVPLAWQILSVEPFTRWYPTSQYNKHLSP